jgi:hypothetical protein
MKTPQELEEEENERKAKIAFKELARILREAKEEKHRMLNEKIANADQGEDEEEEEGTEKKKKRYIIYPDSKFSTLWDMFVTM